jgi:hypothetical protein
MRVRWYFGMLLGTLILTVSSADAAKWSQQYVRQLPDSAFAAIENTSDGQTVRHLPHHDLNANLDIPHLCNAVSRLDQVKWREAANAEVARQHLREHLKEIWRGSCRPPHKSGN